MRRRQAGIGLVELMISLVLGLLVSALAVQMFLSSRSSVSTQEAMSYLQETARYVSYRLQPLMRNVGYAGCANGFDLTTAGTVGAAFDLERPLGGQARTHDGLAYWSLAVAAADKQDGEIPLTASLSGGALPLAGADVTRAFLDGAGNLADTVALVSDCRRTDVFTVTKVGSDGLTTADTLSRPYGSPQLANSFVYPVRAWELVLDDQAGAGSERALYLDSLSAPREEIAAGVTGLTITLSLDTDGDGRIDKLKVPAATVEADGDWNLVRRIELALGLQSQPGVVPGGPNQGRLARTFNLTFTPRNLQLRDS